MRDNSKPFVGFHSASKQSPIIAVDIGYSSRARSCGVAWSGHENSACFRFGDAICKVSELCALFERPIVVIEAALSTYHLPSGNPDLRGAFEKGRGWYWGPGAVSLIAANRFLRALGERLPLRKPIFLAEAFLSNKPERTKHADDATEIVESFWKIEPEVLREGTEPVVDLISGVPSVRVFGTRLSVHANNAFKSGRADKRRAVQRER